MSDLTVIYYTSNREIESFENKIIESLIENSKGLPIVSVSQKPIDLGENICVGNVGVSEINSRRQLLIGAKKAKTKFICSAESDFLYPESFFEFEPPKDNIIYLAVPVFILFVQKGKKTIYSPKKVSSEGCLIVGREYIISLLESMLKGQDIWREKTDGDRKIPHLLKAGKTDTFELDIPVVTFKTDNNMHRRTPHEYKNKTESIHYWGNAKDLRRKYL